MISEQLRGARVALQEHELGSKWLGEERKREERKREGGRGQNKQRQKGEAKAMARRHSRGGGF